MKKLLSLISLSVMTLSPAFASDHLDAPGVQADGQLDITDLYAFQSPVTSDNAVLIMGANPGAGVFSPQTFSTNGVYNFNIDNDGDNLADIVYSFKFYPARRGSNSQQYTIYRLSDAENARRSPRPNRTPALNRVSILAIGRTNTRVRLRQGGMSQSGLFEDPFFFDLDGFNDNFQFTGTDFFAGLRITGIVLEVPRSDLGSDNVAVWATTENDDGQFDRAGRPAINTVLIASNRKDAFNAGSPVTDVAEFGAEVTAAITTLNGGDSATAEAITDVLLPDVLTVDFSNPAGFLNGRGLADDVIDAELDLLTNGALITDGVNSNDAPFRTVFPYLSNGAPPQN